MPTVNPQEAAAGVLGAARLVFAARGYAATSIKAVAAAAGVAPGVVTSLYRNKERLFVAAMRLPFDPAQAVPELIAPGLDGMGERVVGMVVRLLDDPKVRADMTRLAVSSAQSGAASAVLGSGSEAPDGAFQQVQIISEYLQIAVVDPLVGAAGIPDARMRANLISSYLLGVVVTRYLLRVEPLASAGADHVVAVVGPTVQQLLDPTRPVSSP